INAPLIQQLMDTNKSIDINELLEYDYTGRQMTALHLAIINGYDNIVETLLHNGASPNIKNSEGETPLHMAIRLDKMDVVEKLMQAENIDLKIQNNEGNTPLHIAIITGKEALARSLARADTEASLIRNNAGQIAADLRPDPAA
ncbi:MAG TPA: ankyrin repeat domain-containing protein, partial [Opitutales bacterium]|nr:ankyrin repeat domain-containing protein [Opitutales bacterium]